MEMEDLFDEWFLGRTIVELDGGVTYMECKRCGALVRDDWGRPDHPKDRHLEFHRRVES